jgi:outer membrane usher protein
MRPNGGPLPAAVAGCAVLCLLILLPIPAAGAELAVVKIVVNREPHGDFLVVLSPDGDVLLRAGDFAALGVRMPSGEGTVIDEDRYFSIRTLRGSTYLFDRKTVTLQMTVDPSLLTERHALDLGRQGGQQVYYSHDNSAYFNYGVSYRDDTASPLPTVNATGEFGLRFGDYLLLNGAQYRRTGSDADAVRLMTSMVYDRRRELQRITVGDSITPPGAFSGSLNMGGIAFSKVYSINPYFIKTPLMNFEGMVTMPSQADIYLNGVKIRTEQLAPGTFEIKDLASYGGMNNLDVIVRDPLGREQRLAYPFYSTDVLLRRGLHEYSYNLGFIREQYGTASNEYGDDAFVAFHRYGVTDTLTAGLRAEASDRFIAGGAEVTFIPRVGAMTLAGFGSENAGRSGFAMMASYVYQGPVLNARVLTKHYSADFATVTSLRAPLNLRYETGAGVGINMRREGMISLDASRAERHAGEGRTSWGISYSRNITSRAYFYATATETRDIQRERRVFAGINYTFGPGPTLSAQYSGGADSSLTTIQVVQNAPVGEGVGYRAVAEQQEHAGIHSNLFNPFVQYNGPHGIYAAEYQARRSESAGSETAYQVSVSGAAVYVDRTLGLTRPVTDSFALVKVGDVKDVMVYQNNQEIGRTDEEGKVFVPNVGSYQYNTLSFNDRDMPMDTAFTATRRVLSPPFRSGSCVFFNAAKSQPVTGVLLVDLPGGPVAAEHADVVLQGDAGRITFTTGLGGEFYLESLDATEPAGDAAPQPDCAFRGKGRETKPGVYQGSFRYRDRECAFSLTVPVSDDLIIDLGAVTACRREGEAAPAGPALPGARTPR